MNEQELKRLVELFGGTVYRAAYCYVKNSADADDIMQDAFLALYTCGKSFSGDEHIKAWLIRVAVNRSKNLLRSSHRRLSVPLELAEDIPHEDGHTDSLLPQVMKLKPKYRIVLYMFYYEDMSVRRIAEVLGESASAVTTRLSRARTQLKKLLLEEGYNE